MEFKRLFSHFTYKIEAKPEGGFIAHASDASIPPLEAPTREELQQKIQANIASTLAAEFPGLKLPQQNQAKFNFHIEHKPGGGFILNSTDGKELPVVGGTHAEIENKFAEKILSAFGKEFMTQLSQAFAAKAGAGDVKVTVNRNVSFSTRPADNAQGASLLNAANSPILPEPNRLWPFARFVLAALIFAAIIYFFRYR